MSAPEVAQAAQIALMVMKKVRCQNWAGVIARSAEADLTETVWLTAEQQDLIDRFANILPYLSTSPLVTVAACPVCGRFGFQDRRAAGTRCIFTFRCQGKPVKASTVAARRTTPGQPVENAPEEEDNNSPNQTADPADDVIDDGIFD